MPFYSIFLLTCSEDLIDHRLQRIIVYAVIIVFCPFPDKRSLFRAVNPLSIHKEFVELRFIESLQSVFVDLSRKDVK